MSRLSAQEADIVQGLRLRVLQTQQKLTEVRSSLSQATASKEEHRAILDSVVEQGQHDAAETDQLRASLKQSLCRHDTLRCQLEEARTALQTITDGEVFREGTACEDHSSLHEELQCIQQRLHGVRGENVELQKLLLQAHRAPKPPLRQVLSARPAWDKSRFSSPGDRVPRREGRGETRPDLAVSKSSSATTSTPRTPSSVCGDPEAKKVVEATNRLCRGTDELQAKLLRERARAAAFAMRADSLRLRVKQLEGFLHHCREEHATILTALQSELEAGAGSLCALMDLAAQPLLGGGLCRSPARCETPVSGPGPGPGRGDGRLLSPGSESCPASPLGPALCAGGPLPPRRGRQTLFWHSNVLSTYSEVSCLSCSSQLDSMPCSTSCTSLRVCGMGHSFQNLD
ncbi:unnamed protein product [Polarella glacialis]|uniref:Uncharacterized protein n=1 Tax=Polarella glacialis TaxID=89957 RepID=A0A813JB90_POLGL|nr:unnamed protein product [Polarella glacialis]